MFVLKELLRAEGLLNVVKKVQLTLQTRPLEVQEEIAPHTDAEKMHQEK